MRKRARERDGEEDEGWQRGERGRRGRDKGEGRKQRREECSVTDASGHINFFTDLQKGVRSLLTAYVHVHVCGELIFSCTCIVTYMHMYMFIMDTCCMVEMTVELPQASCLVDHLPRAQRSWWPM